jgi:hypothetical protein
MDNPKVEPRGNAEKNPDEWTTGDQPMTGAQASYLKTLCEEAGEAFDATLTKAEASKRIDEIAARTGQRRAHHFRRHLRPSDIAAIAIATAPPVVPKATASIT